MVKIIDSDGEIRYLNADGDLHRLDGPAVEQVEGERFFRAWFINGLLHRIGAPAVEDSEGVKCWYENGKRHRLDGPAIDDERKSVKRWFINGVEYIDGKVADVQPKKESNKLQQAFPS